MKAQTMHRSVLLNIYIQGTAKVTGYTNYDGSYPQWAQKS